MSTEWQPLRNKWFQICIDRYYEKGYISVIYGQYIRYIPKHTKLTEGYWFDDKSLVWARLDFLLVSRRWGSVSETFLEWSGTHWYFLQCTCHEQIKLLEVRTQSSHHRLPGLVCCGKLLSTLSKIKLLKQGFSQQCYWRTILGSQKSASVNSS